MLRGWIQAAKATITDAMSDGGVSAWHMPAGIDALDSFTLADSMMTVKGGGRAEYDSIALCD